MPTNNFVESSFWNFDSLFQPQQHPARDAHDTFFMAGQGKTCFLDTFCYNHGQRVLRILHFLTPKCLSRRFGTAMSFSRRQELSTQTSTFLFGEGGGSICSYHCFQELYLETRHGNVHKQ